MGTTRAEGAVPIGLGETIRENAWGRDRKHVVARENDTAAILEHALIQSRRRYRT